MVLGHFNGLVSAVPNSLTMQVPNRELDIRRRAEVVEAAQRYMMPIDRIDEWNRRTLYEAPYVGWLIKTFACLILHSLLNNFHDATFYEMGKQLTDRSDLLCTTCDFSV